MKISRFSKVLFIACALCVLTAGITFAQDKKEASAVTDKEATLNADGSYSSKLNEAERPEDSYLAKFHAQDIVEKLLKRNLEQIYMLKVVVSNFTAKSWKGEYDKVYTGYKDATELFYKRNIIYARVGFENNRKSINVLLNTIAKDYLKETNLMLDDCANQIMMLMLNQKTRSDPNKNNELFRNQMRLRIAYGQLDDGNSSILDNNPEVAIYHFRVAKSYAIRILEDLAPQDKKQEIMDKYKYHKADNLNRIFDKDKDDEAPKKDTSKETPK